MSPIGALIAWIDRAVVLPSDDEEERVRKRAVSLVGFAAMFMAGGVVLTWVYLGLLVPVLLGTAWILTFFAGFTHMLRTKRAEPFMYVQIVGTPIGMFLAQMALGGFVASSGLLFWGITGPFAAVYMRARIRALWVGLFVLLASSAGLVDHWVSLHAAHVPEAWITVGFVVNSAGLLAFVYFPIRYVVDELVRLKGVVERERERSEALLLNILPRVIADRLKDGETTIADRFDEVTVLFADIVGFTPLSVRLPPHAVVELLNELFSGFDELAERHGLEKIKTIGDSYMAVAGLPSPRDDHAQAAIEVAQEMLTVVARCREKRGLPLDVRIGLHSGEVLAAVIGKRKFAYDVYGDTVNTACRMESHGLPGSVQVSEDTYRRLKDIYHFEAREAIEVKGKGRMVTYLLVGRRSVETPLVSHQTV